MVPANARTPMRAGPPSPCASQGTRTSSANAQASRTRCSAERGGFLQGMAAVAVTMAAVRSRESARAPGKQRGSARHAPKGASAGWGSAHPRDRVAKTFQWSFCCSTTELRVLSDPTGVEPMTCRSLLDDSRADWQPCERSSSRHARANVMRKSSRPAPRAGV